jgi:ATP-dependent helicase/nuclease subunit A
VIDTVNAAMATAREADGYDGFREHTTASGLAGAVGRLPPIPRNKDEEEASPLAAGWRDSLTMPRELPEETLRTREARQAAAWISEQIAGGLRPQDVMVLSRKRAGLLAAAGRTAGAAHPRAGRRKNRADRLLRSARHGGAARRAGVAAA